MEELGNGCRGLDAHSPGMVVPGSLPRTTWLDVAFRDPGSVGEDYDLVVLHTGFVSLCWFVVDRTYWSIIM